MNYYQELMVAESVVSPVLDAIYLLIAENKIDDAIYLLFMSVDLWYEKKNYIFINKLLELVDLNKLDINLMIGFLSITLPDKERLYYRSTFYNKIKDKIILSDHDRINSLLCNLD